MTALTRPAGAIPVAAGAALLGEVITWTCSGVTVRHLDLIDALSACGVEPAPGAARTSTESSVWSSLKSLHLGR